jgi:hypothetical protein
VPAESPAAARPRARRRAAWWRRAAPRCALALALALSAAGHSAAGEQDKLDPHYPFRTDWANQQLPWYQVKLGEFPPHHSDHRVGGELIAADYIHRSGVMRRDGTGELMPFTMPPYASVYYLDAEADLRDVPLGTFFLFFLNQDPHGEFTLLATMQDEYTMLANHGFSYRIDALKLGEHKLAVVKLKASAQAGDSPAEVGRNELLVDEQTRVWKGEARIALADLAIGEVVLVNLSGTGAQRPRRCTDLWVGVETHHQVTEQQRKRHVASIKERGLPAWIDHVDGRKLTVTLLSSEPSSLNGLFKDEGIDPAKWAKENQEVQVVVADENLRSYWPVVSKKGGSVREYQTVPTDCYGCSGVRWVIEVNELLEGFRAGRNIRIFPHTWPVKDMPFGEGLHGGGHDIDEPPEALELVAGDYPYRTDFGNAQLPWYRLEAGRFPPDHSAHQVIGDLVEVGPDQRSAVFRPAQGGEPLRIALAPCAAVLLHGAEAALADLPLGMRCRLDLHPDQQGGFTIASAIRDEYSWMAGNTATYRLEAIRLGEGRLFAAHQTEAVKVDYQLEPRQAPDFGRLELLVDGQTRVWKGEGRIALADLAAGDVLMVDLAAGGRCSDLWVGADTRKRITDQQRERHRTATREHGAPAWVTAIDGKRVTVTFFAGVRHDVAGLIGGEPRGKHVTVVPCDELLRAQGPPASLPFLDRPRDDEPDGAFGGSGAHWQLEAAKPELYHVGEVVRVSKEGWAPPVAGAPAGK